MIKITTNITVPNKPVTALNGISESVNVLDKMSTKTINVPPNVTQSGIVLLASLPANNLTMCGMTKPIQEIVPQKQTEIAVRIVEITIISGQKVRHSSI